MTKSTGRPAISPANDKRGPLLLYTRMKETGLCENWRIVSRFAIEKLVLKPRVYGLD